MPNFIIAGIGTEVGKTVVSAILTTLFQGDYWKPVQTGEEEVSDTSMMQTLIDTTKHRIHPPAYSFKAPVSPHAASRMENTSINPDNILLPHTLRPLIIEMAGGIFTPLSLSSTAVSKSLFLNSSDLWIASKPRGWINLDLFKCWQGTWILVSKHYLGSINHTLLTHYALKQHNIHPAGLIFNGKPDLDTEEAILQASKLPLLGRLLPEPTINPKTIQKYAEQWKPQFLQMIH